MGDDQIQEENSLKRQFTSVTPFSKYLALTMLVVLPFVGFWFGIQYQSRINESDVHKQIFEDISKIPITTSEPSEEIDDPIDMYPVLESIEEEFYIVDEKVFIYELGYKWVELEGADAETFEHVGELYDPIGGDSPPYHQIFKDKNFVYLGLYTEAVNNSVPSTFEILNEIYAKDNKNVYLGSEVVENIDPQSFEVINERYSKDKDNVYEYIHLEGHSIVSGVNPSECNSVNIEECILSQ